MTDEYSNETQNGCNRRGQMALFFFGPRRKMSKVAIYNRKSSCFKKLQLCRHENTSPTSGALFDPIHADTHEGRALRIQWVSIPISIAISVGRHFSIWVVVKNGQKWPKVRDSLCNHVQTAQNPILRRPKRTKHDIDNVYRVRIRKEGPSNGSESKQIDLDRHFAHERSDGQKSKILKNDPK